MPYQFGQPWTPVYQDSPLLSQAVKSDQRRTAAEWKGARPQGAISKPKRTLGELINDKAGDVLGKVLPKQAARKLADLIDYSPVGVATQAFQIGQDARQSKYGQAAMNALGTALDVAPVGKVAHSIIAPLWHGSPHKFEKFMLDKIGTGEGAQAYGHGLYFAEHPEVARQYQRILGYKHTGGAPATNWDDPASVAGYWTNWHGGDVGKARDEIQRIYDGNLKAQPKGNHSVTKAALDFLNEGGAPAASPNPGHLYEVKLDANPEDFLDWDAPLAGQPGKSADFLHSELNRYLGSTYERQIGNFAPKEAGELLAATRGVNATGPGLTQDALEAGIPGLRYFDQGSRGTGDGTRNYVVFDPSIIDITNRY